MPGFFARPVLWCADIHRTREFYTDKLGFHEAWRYAEDGEPRVVQLSREGCDVIFTCQEQMKTGPATLFLSLDPPDLDAFRTEVEARGVATEEGQWGYRLLVIRDPDGHQLLFNYSAEDEAAPAAAT